MRHLSLTFFIFHMIIDIGFSDFYSCSQWGAYSANSTYRRNLNTLLSSLPSEIISNRGFYNTSSGQDPDKVYALGFCRGDISSDKCYSCANSTIQGITKLCPNQKEAISWTDQVCMIRYANRNIFARMETSPSECVENPNNVSENSGQFNKTLYDLVGKLTAQASSGSCSGVKFATGNSGNVFGMAQCSLDIPQGDCSTCLQGAMVEMEECNGGKEGGRILRPSCVLQFENFKFYDSTNCSSSSPLSPLPANGSPPTMTSTKGNKSKTLKTVILIAVPLAILVMLIILGCAILRKRRLRQKVEKDDAAKRLKSLQYELSTIKAATDDFSDANKLGQGGFGSVYKGVLPNGQKIAVKRLSGYSSQGEGEFKNEILLLAKLQHRNLVSLIGFCSEGTEKILVYELVSNRSLNHFIFDHQSNSMKLNWETRYKIINGIARGILYLHEDSRLKIIHRDLKASNVLLDEEMNPKISDFGLARLFVLDQTHGVTSKVAGTYGYMAPEYVLQNQFSVKSDVFSFGVLVMETVSGKQNSWLDGSGEIHHLLSHAWQHWTRGTALNLVDNTLRSSPGGNNDILRCIHIGLLCCQENAADRPIMSSVLTMLSSHSISLRQPLQPAFFMYANTNADMYSSVPNSQQHISSDQSTEYTEARLHFPV